MSPNVTLHDLNVADPQSRLPFKPCTKIYNAVGAEELLKAV